MEHSGHHGHDHGDLKGKRLGITILLNVFITIAQLIGGLISGSLSLLADALHNFSDVIALLVSYAAAKLAQRDYTALQTYGYRRAEVIAAMINACTLIGISVVLVIEAAERLTTVPEQISVSYVVGLALLSIAVNGASVLLLKSGASDNMNMRSAYLHLFSDMITSMAVLAGGVAMYLYEIYWLDGVLCIGIAIYLVTLSLKLLFQTLKVLMHFTPAHIDLNEVKALLETQFDIHWAHHMHIWQLDDNDIHFEVHIDFEQDLPLSEVSGIIAEMEAVLDKTFSINHATIQPGYAMDDSKLMIVDERVQTEQVDPH
jgi:cobalt-zinc-cadmium efflux system protein